MRTRAFVGLGLVVILIAVAVGYPLIAGQSILTPTDQLSDQTSLGPPVLDVSVATDQAVELAKPAENTLPPSTVATDVPATVVEQKPAARSGSILANMRVVTYYGHPADWRMGILGQLSDNELVSALFRRAAIYEEAGGKPVIPAIHLIVSVAQDNPGADGMWRARTADEDIQHYIDLAQENGMLIFLDVQNGRSSVQEELQPLLPYLAQSNVHLALDPEFDMWGGQIPGDEIGHMTANEINYATAVLSDIVAEQGGSNKILIVHQFTPFMIADKENVALDPNVDFVTDMDGFGDWALKTKHYDMFVRDELLQFGGMKLFFDQDTPLVSSEDVMALEPIPDVIIYQ
jgi:hypothetical protein